MCKNAPFLFSLLRLYDHLDLTIFLSLSEFWLFMSQYTRSLLSLFTTVSSVHQYNTRQASKGTEKKFSI